MNTYRAIITKIVFVICALTIFEFSSAGRIESDGMRAMNARRDFENHPLNGTVIHDIKTPFDWYVPQGYPAGYPQKWNGLYADTAGADCGPASIAMVIRYLSQTSLQPRPDQVRATDPTALGHEKQTNTSQLVTMLKAYGVPNVNTFPNSTTLADTIINSISNNYLIVIPFVAGNLSRSPTLQIVPANPNSPPPSCPSGKRCTSIDGTMYSFDNAKTYADYNVGRYYDWSGGHWIVIKGIGQIGSETYAIVYDPDTWVTNPKYYYGGLLGEDISFIMGFDRWYKLSELISGINDSVIQVPYLPGQLSLNNPSTSKPTRSSAPASDIRAIQQVSDVTIPPGTILTAGRTTLKTWTVANVGTSWFMQEYNLVQTSGTPLQTLGQPRFPELISGASKSVSLLFVTPQIPGTYNSTWQVADPNGTPVQGTLSLSFIVNQSGLPPMDNATFVSDITIPDGTLVSPGQSLVKTWRMQNTGSSTWGNGYQLAFVNGEQMGAPASVSIPTTSPGNTTDISINLTAPTISGNPTHVGYWRLRNPQGVYFGPTISVKVTVQSPSNYITILTADPPSPANASTVRVHVIEKNFPNFRSMRLKIDGNIVYELGAPEFYYNWNTSGYSSGNHSIVIEVADKTDTSWSHPERSSIVYTLLGNSSAVNHAPNRPSPTSPYNWFVYYSGNTAQICAQANGDPDNDSVTGYYFDIYNSAQLWNSGWVSGNCVTTGALGPYNYQWRAKVQDSRGGISDWSDTWNFTIVNPNLSITQLSFNPQDSNSESVQILACTAGQGGIGITMRVSVNDANDGLGNGNWNIVKELGVPCFSSNDAPIWNTLDYGDGSHRVRVEAHGVNAGWNGAAVLESTYTLPHRRPTNTRLSAPVPLSGNGGEAVFLNSRNITFTWGSTLRANSYTLSVGNNPSPKDDPNPIYRATFTLPITQWEVFLSQDYPTLHWQVSTSNDMGTNASGDQLIGIDRVAPICTVQPLAPVSYDSVFQVTWGGSDNLAGVRTYDIQYLDSGRTSWNDWLTSVPVAKTYDLFTGQPGHSYSFHCRATDNANNTGNYPTNADTTTKIDPAARPPTPWWNSAYGAKRNLTILNNMPSANLPSGYPVHLHFDGGTTPTAADLYNASQASTKCNDLRIVYNDATELNRVTLNCSSSAIDFWFRTQAGIGSGSSNNTSYQIYYGNASAGSPPADSNQVWYPFRESDTSYLYFFQEGSGSTTYDSSGNGHTCSIDSSVQWAPSKFGNGLRFNRSNGGNSRSLSCGSAVALSSFTIEFWYKPDPDDGGRIAGALGNGVGNDWLAEVLSGHLSVTVWPCQSCGSSQVQSNATVTNAPYAGNWNHIAITFNGGNQVNFYINGVLDSTQYLQQSGINGANPPLEIGSAEGQSQIKANLGELRISNGVKSSFPYGLFGNTTNEPTTAAGVSVAPPITGSSNLAILGLTAFPNASGGVLIQGVIQNQGNLSTQDGFYTDLYANHTPTGIGDYTNIGQFWVADPVAAGASITVTTILTNPTGLAAPRRVKLAATTETTSTFYLQIDSTGAISPTNRTGDVSAGLPICTASSDSYESDSSAATASSITLGTIQPHNFDVAGDQDWVKFSAQAGVTYRIQTSNLGPNADTYLYLYGTDGTTLLASNDDDSGTLASRIDWKAPTSGTYYAMVKHWNPNAGGCGTTFDLSVTTSLPNKFFLPFISR